MSRETLNGLRVAVVGPLPPPAGGMANQAKQLRFALEQQGAQLEFVRVNSPYRPQFVGNIKGFRALFRLLPYFFDLWRKLRKVELVHVLANSGWSWHLYVVPAVWVAWLLNKNVVINYHGGEASTFFNQSWGWVRPTIGKCRFVTVPSVYLQRVFDAYGIKAKVVPNIIDLERFNDTGKWEQRINDPHIVVTRNLEAIYGVDTVLKAFAIIKKEWSGALLTVAGSGPEEEALKALADSLGLQNSVTFSGRLGSEQIVKLYQSADLLLNGSKVDNTPMSLIESLASGVPVVTSNVGGIPDLVINNQSAMLVSPNQPIEMSDAALKVLADEGLRRRLVENGKNVALSFDKYKVIDLLGDVYRKALS